MKWERRSVEFRATPVSDGPTQDGLPRRFWARIMNYDTLDDYGTKFAPGVFTESLARRLPRLMYGHAGWENPAALLGRGIDFRDAADGLDVLFEFDDFEYVPMARQIAYQLSNDPDNPTLNEFSVGFVRQRDTRGTDGKPVITKARLGEGSIVVEGSVPGTKLLSFRNSEQGSSPFGSGALIDANDAARILARFSLGEIDLAQALEDVKGSVLPPEEEETEEPPAEEPSAEEPAPPPAEEPAADDEPSSEAGEDAGDPPDAGASEENPPAEEPASEPAPDEDEDEDDAEDEAILAEIDADLADVEIALSRNAPIETRAASTFQGNQHAGSRTDTSDVEGSLHVGRLADTPAGDHESWGARPSGTVVSIGGGGARVLTGRTKMWRDGKWTPHLAFSTEVGGKVVSTHSSVAAAKKAAGKDITWTDR